MRVTTGTVVAGQVVLDNSEFIDGTQVVVVSRDEETDVRLSPEELAELEAGIAEADRGDMISGEELFARLRRHG
jgi:predicted transcriptional regulator